MKYRLLIHCLMAGAALAACSSETAYRSTQNWQRMQCEKLLSSQDREQCLKNAGMSHDDYEKERESLKK